MYNGKLKWLVNCSSSILDNKSAAFKFLFVVEITHAASKIILLKIILIMKKHVNNIIYAYYMPIICKSIIFCIANVFIETHNV